MTIKTTFDASCPAVSHDQTRGDLTEATATAGAADRPAAETVTAGAVQQSRSPTGFFLDAQVLHAAPVSDQAEPDAPLHDPHGMEKVGDEEGQTSEGHGSHGDTVGQGKVAPWAECEPEIAAFFEILCAGMPLDFALGRNPAGIVHRDTGVTFCAPLRVVSFPRRPDGAGWAMEVEFMSRDRTLQRATFPLTELSTQSGKVVAGLIDRGLVAYADASSIAYYLRKWGAVGHSWRADGPGWFTDPAGRRTFVRADGAIHQQDTDPTQPVVLVGTRPASIPQAGNLKGWQDEVAARALGNPALIFAISAALAGPLLRLVGIETAGFNVFGSPSVGKSLLLRLSLSCVGNPGGVPPWTAAETGLHRLSGDAQDGLLLLDSFPRDPAAKLIKALLALGDDAGAGRVDPVRDPDGGSRFRRVLLSTSELPLATVLRRKKKDPPAALALRLIDIPAEQGRHGLVDSLHGHADGPTFARSLEAAMNRHHGHLLPAFLDRLVADLEQVTANLVRSLPDHAARLASELPSCFHDSANTAPAVLHLIAERFALVSQAGELAIAFGLLPWPVGTAREAARFMARLAHHPVQTAQTGAAHSLGAFRSYVERNAGRIIDLAPEGAVDVTDDVLGWRDADHVYLRSEPVRNELAELDALLDVLNDCGALKPGGEARSLQYKLPATKVPGRPRTYRIDRKIIEEDGNG